MNLGLIFLTGLTTGGLTCIALQGGLLATALANDDGRKMEKILSFLVAKLLAYTILGLLLGWLGSLISLTPLMRGWLQILIGIYLLGVAGAMLDLHPIFRYFIIRPPKQIARLAKNQTGSDSWLTPALLGAMTVMLPCATTQAMEVIALGTGNAWQGALIMMTFILGTSPTFLAIGFVLAKTEGNFKNWFDKAAVALMIFLAVLSVNSGLAVMGSVYTLQNFAKVAFSPSEINQTEASENVSLENGIQKVTINVSNYGYEPQLITIKSGYKTELKLITNNTQGCSRSFTIPSLGIKKILPITGEETIEFTPKQGTLVFSCSMGMYTGQFKVI